MVHQLVRAVVCRQAHNLKVAGSNPAPATKYTNLYRIPSRLTIEATFLRSKLLPLDTSK